MIKRTAFFLLLLLQTVIILAQNDFYQRLSDAAKELVNPNIVYDPSYFSMGYPGGDVPADRGVCTDVVVRAYRRLGIDLQKEVHEDMSANFSLYPGNWRLTRPDRNIDHRRVPNLMTFFSRHGEVLGTTDNPEDYQPGNIICWDLGGKAGTHIGIVVNQKSADGERYLVFHNIGGGQVIEDCLFRYYRIIGHYRYKKSDDQGLPLND